MLANKVMGATSAAPDLNYIEDVFSTYLYTGNGSTQTINNGIDLAGKGGLTWVKNRFNAGGWDHYLVDSAASGSLSSNTTNAAVSPKYITQNADGFTLLNGSTPYNATSDSYTSWTFRKQPKFFDVVTYTGNGTNGRAISHSLEAAPGCIIVKRTNSTGNWPVWHTEMFGVTFLNTTAVQNTTLTKTYFGDGTDPVGPTATQFTVGNNADVNASGGTYVAYLFAHNAGGFGLSGNENVVSCGGFNTGPGNDTPVIDLGYEPQFVMFKASSGTNYTDWHMFDNIRGTAEREAKTLLANSSNSEQLDFPKLTATATGFYAPMTSTAGTYIYIAIRRGPMKVPTDATKVLGINARTGTGANVTVTGNSSVTDLAIIKNRGELVAPIWTNRVAGWAYLQSSNNQLETGGNSTVLQDYPWDVMSGVKIGTTSPFTNASSNTYINYLFSRAPEFFDISCYKGTGVAKTVPHNLKKIPELIIVRARNDSASWWVYDAATGPTKYHILNSGGTATTSTTAWNDTAPSASVFNVGTATNVNGSGLNYIAYLFSSCPGVSKVGSYIGNGTSQVINCGFTNGARFVLVRRTDSGGSWQVVDTARGLVAAGDPTFYLNSFLYEETTDWIDPNSSGFEVVQETTLNSNVNGASYIFLAVA